MIVEVTKENAGLAGLIHSRSWQESHRSFCSPEFIAIHTPEHQKEYLSGKIEKGSRVFMLVTDIPIGVVSVTDSLIEDLYILPEYQRNGYGTELLSFAISQCRSTPTLWILENNAGAEKLYRRYGFTPTGNRNQITDKLDEIEFAYLDHT